VNYRHLTGVSGGLTGLWKGLIIRDPKKIMGETLDDTCFLFANPSFLTGFASVLDIGGAMRIYNVSPSGEEADERAIASDWAVVGSEIRNAAKTFGQEESETKKKKA